LLPSKKGTLSGKKEGELYFRKEGNPFPKLIAKVGDAASKEDRLMLG
jgi:hypothetical protein